MSNAVKNAEIANSIYPGTVSGILIYKSTFENDSQTQAIANSLAAYRNRTSSIGVSLGIREIRDYHCFESEHTLQLVQLSDILICPYFPKDMFSWDGTSTEHFIETITVYWLAWRTKMKAINPNVIVYGETGWPAA